MKTTRSEDRSSCNQAISLSPVSLGRTLILIASSCSALSTKSSILGTSPNQRSWRVEGIRRVGRSDGNVMLRYRELDEYHESTNASSRLKDTFAIKFVSPTPTITKKVKAPSVGGDEQVVMDEYLEFVERRYTRIHGRKSTSKPSDSFLPGKLISSTLVYSQASPSPVPADTDVLKALGLTGFASEKLRQRLGVPRELRDHSLMTKSTETAVNFFNYLTHPEQQHTSIKEGGRNSSFVGLNFMGQFVLMMKSLKRLFEAYIKSIKLMAYFAGRTFPAILEKGGFRQSIRMMSVASVTILLMFRPLFKGSINQG